MASPGVRVSTRRRASRREGMALHTVEYWPAGSALRAVVVFHHGLAEHCGRYAYVGKRYAQAGIAFLSYDAMNHGLSDSEDAADRAYIDDFEHLVDDLTDYANSVREALSSRGGTPPMYLHGHSMGGLVCSYAALRNQSMWRGLVLNSPLMGVEGGLILRMQMKVGAVLAALAPHAKLVPAAQPSTLSQDPEVVRSYVEDPLVVQGNVRSKTAYNLLQAFQRLEESYSLIELPVLAIHGQEDTVCSLQAVKRFLDGLSSKDKRLVIMPGGWHELVHGPEKQELMTKVLDWVAEHMPARSNL